MLKTENLSKQYNQFFAVKNVNLKINRGETIGFLGPNGAGKTTTIKLIAGLSKPSAGKILIRNKYNKLQDISDRKKDLISMGFLIDQPIFYDSTPNVLLNYYAQLHQYPKNKIDQRIDELLRYFDLINWKRKRIKKFSKGMIQKLGFIQAVFHDPEILILDEPQMGLDPRARIKIRHYLNTLKEKNKTIFIASHILHEISELCDKIAFIDNGKIIKYDKIEKMKLQGSNEVKCQLLKPISTDKIHSVEDKLIEKLGPYLDRNINSTIVQSPIIYHPQNQTLTIYYDGTSESKGEIFKILGRDFESDFTVISFSESKLSLLEKLYLDQIK